MTSTMTISRPEFTVVRRLRDLGADGQRAVVPRQRFSTDLRTRLVAGAQPSQALRRASGSDCSDC